MSEATKGAVRAAKAVLSKMVDSNRVHPIEELAAAVDQETGLPELLEAAKSALSCGAIRFESCVLDKTIKQKLEAALAKAKGD